MLTRSQLIRRSKIIVSSFKRIGLRNKEFSIISNNCWGGMIYDEYHLQYRTPTIGLWIPANDYLRFISNIRYYLSLKLQPINYRDSHVSQLIENRKLRGRYSQDLNSLIVGRLGDVDIIFLHYKSFEDAKEKWERRAERVDFQKLIVKFNDQNGFQKEDYDAFCKLNYKHKLFFTSHDEYLEHNWCYLFNCIDDEGNVNDTVINKQPFKIKKLLNSMLDDME